MFTLLLDIATNFANNRLKKLNKLTSEKEKKELLNTSIIEMKNNTKFPFLDKAYLGKGELKEIKEFMLTNGIFYDICLARETFNITCTILSQFIMKKLNCSAMLPQSLSPTFINLKNKVQKSFESTKACRKREILAEPFFPPQPKIVVQTEIARNNSQTTISGETETQDSELSLLESSFSDLAWSIAELNTSCFIMKLKVEAFPWVLKN